MTTGNKLEVTCNAPMSLTFNKGKSWSDLEKKAQHICPEHIELIAQLQKLKHDIKQMFNNMREIEVKLKFIHDIMHKTNYEMWLKDRKITRLSKEVQGLQNYLNRTLDRLSMLGLDKLNIQPITAYNYDATTVYNYRVSVKNLGIPLVKELSTIDEKLYYLKIK